MTNSQEKSLSRIKNDLLYCTPNEKNNYSLLMEEEMGLYNRYFARITRRYKDCSLTDYTIMIQIGTRGKIWYASYKNNKNGSKYLKWKPYKGNIWSAICEYKLI